MNNKILIRTISVFLILSLIFISVLSCKSGDGSPQNETPALDSDNPVSLPEAESDESEAEIKDSLPDGLDFDRKDLSIVIWNSNPEYGCGADEFIAEEENGETLNDAVYKRNKIVEDRLNIKLNIIPENDVGALHTKVRANIAAGDNTYDLIAGFAASTPALGLDGLFANLLDVPYIDCGKPWWNQNIINGATVGGKLNFLAGDTNVSVLAYCMLFFVNKKMMSEYELPDIYDVVFDGKWTLDYMSGYIKDINKDLNGDGVMDKNDLYGFSGPRHPAHLGAFMEAAGIQITKIDGNGKPYFAMDTERMATLVDKVYDILYNNPSSFIGADSNYDYYVIDKFKNDEVLLTLGGIADAALLRDMESDFAMVPYPKYDESQEKYLAGVAPYYSILCIPVNSTTLEMTGAAMEAMASESYKTVTPAYFDVMMKIKFARDEASLKMLDIIRESAYIDFSTIYNDSINRPWNALYDLLTNRRNTFASWYESNEPRIQSGIDNLIGKMEASGSATP